MRVDKGHGPLSELVLTVVFMWILVACGTEQVEAGAGVQITTVVTGLDGPTQLAIAPDGTWFISQLVGDENTMTGQVVRLDPENPDGSRAVILDGLDKPTGVAVFDGDLWVMERQRLIRAGLDGTGVTVVLENMAFNGRSGGSLTVDGDRLLFDTSGRLSARTDEPVDPMSSSGVLWAISGDGVISPVAYGFKHAYAQTRSADGTLWTTEVADGTYDGEPAIDEVVAITPGADHGWPRCVDDNRVVVEHGGTDEFCSTAPRSQALFAEGATPIGIAVAPWDADVLLVALWVGGEVVAVSADPADAGSEPEPVYGGAARPQNLVVDGDRVLLVDHVGEIVALTKEPQG